MKFTQTDLQQIKSKGISESDVNKQIELFKNGIPFTNIAEAATIGNGIMALDKTVIDNAITKFESSKNDLSLVKFVPASGAASRMFKFLFKFLEDYNPKEHTLNTFIKNNELKDIAKLLDGIEKLPFYNAVRNQLNKNDINYTELSSNEKLWRFVQTMLDEEQLNFGNQPKGLLPFHKYKTDHIATAFEEHLYEAALYASSGNTAKLHFTISEQHKDKFNDEFNSIKEEVEKNTGVTFNISFSYQHTSTDTIAVTLDDTPFREEDGSILFRPSGHGALLKNLDTIDADVIFIKNIDNVVVKEYKEEVAKYKKVLAGILLKLQNKTFEFLNLLDKEYISKETLSAIETFIDQEMSIRVSEDYKTFSDAQKVEYLKEKLNRPIRICGMVKNEGEPGGGPFWVKDTNGNYTLQIVESAQIDLNDQAQNSILQNATHFNPVDLICGVRNYKGEKFNLDNYIDHKAAFITQKTKSGNDLKALELPGLWNGSMAFWNTIFVEIPVITFNPVKTVNDLLKDPHQL